jgi:type IV secretory pathway VirB10-like protein
MQLILPQSELEQAIKNYVNDLMNVKDGTELSIDLKAGRGLDGFTATVDIIKAGTAMPAKTVVPAAVIPAPVPVAAPVKVTPRPVAKEEPVAEEKPAEDTSVANKSEQQEAASEAKEEAPAEAPSTVRRPLFGSLKKPE